jgi:erythromycin esterase
MLGITAIVLPLIAVAHLAHAETADDAIIEHSAEFSRWANASSLPICPGTDTSTHLTALGALIGRTPIVALGEGIHLAREPLEFRNELFKYLVTEKGFTAIAIESGVTESRAVFNFVRGTSGTLESAVSQGFAWTFDRLPQNVELVRWLREFNANPQHARKVSFYGFDIPGSPGESGARRGPDTALSETLKYLSTVDPHAAPAFESRITPVLSRLQLNIDSNEPRQGYETLTRGERDALTATISDLIALLERRERLYIGRSSEEDYEWAHRSAIGARQVDNWLRQFPVGYRAIGGQLKTLFMAGDARDRAMVDNLEWIVNREGSRGKVLVFAHTVHLSADAASFSWKLSTSGAEPPHGKIDHYLQQVAGTYLRQRFGKKLLLVGNIVGHGAVGYAGVEQPLGPPAPGSVAAFAANSSRPCYLLDMRRPPPSIASLLDQRQSLGHGEQAFGLSTDVSLRVGRAFDILYYIDAVNPAAPAR